MRTAAKLMYVGAGLSLVTFLVGMLRLGDLREVARRQNPDAPAATLDAAVNLAIGTIVILGLLGAGLWVWMAIMNQRGRSWARILATVFFALNTLNLFSAVANAGENLANLIVSGLIWLVGLGAILLLWRKENTPHYAGRTAAPPPGWPGQPPSSSP